MPTLPHKAMSILLEILLPCSEASVTKSSALNKKTEKDPIEMTNDAMILTTLNSNEISRKTTRATI